MEEMWELKSILILFLLSMATVCVIGRPRGLDCQSLDSETVKNFLIVDTWVMKLLRLGLSIETMAKIET